jgi:hypothetical protein
MKRNPIRWLLCLTVVAPILSQGAVANPLPAAIAALVPDGAKVSSPSCAKTPYFVAASFTAEKKLSGDHNADYNFDLLSYDTNSPLWKMQGPIYQADRKNKIDSKRRSFHTGTNPPITYDAVKEAKYSWGTGFTQKVVHHYMGAGKGPDYVDYSTAYVGMIGGVMFELSASGVRTAEEADQWAKTVASKAPVLTIANLGN